MSIICSSRVIDFSISVSPVFTVCDRTQPIARGWKKKNQNGQPVALLNNSIAVWYKGKTVILWRLISAGRTEQTCVRV